MQTIPAIYENGVFKPIAPVDLPSGVKVDVLIPATEDVLIPATEDDPVAIMKSRFPNSFGGLSDEDAEEMRTAIEQEFERIDADDWK